ncbi:hypothetical protein GOP47_0014490 [Adiantum capillus-veneris]|uniref:Uncharacterized protein n=1 Tax=Adiantum capillus-veneris TaxID=13818 RepID=A0A9D4ZDJ5_ADICA|nr:hypothetical protein GOP47_0014490 [Adiantum capillus-veneris]
MDVSGPSHEDIMASNVLAFLSSSNLKPATELSSSDHSPAPALEKGLLNYSNDSSRNSSASMESFKSRAKGAIVSGARHEFSDLDDDGLQGNRMKPLSSLQNNCVNRMRLAVTQFSKRRSPNSHQNQASSKILAAARAGPRTRHKATYYCDNKENKQLHDATQTKETCPKHKGVKRKSPVFEGNARLLLLKQRRSTLSSWRTMTSSPKNESSVVNILAVRSISNCEEGKVFSKKTKPVTQEETYTFSKAVDCTKHIQGGNNLLQEAAICKQPKSALTVHSILSALQGSNLPVSGLKDQNNSLSSADHAKNEMQLNFSSSKSENLVDLPLTKPPTYPKMKQNVSAGLSGRCSSHVVVNSSCSKTADAVDLICQGNVNSDQTLSSSLLERQIGQSKFEEDSVCFTEEAGILMADFGAKDGLANHTSLHHADSFATSQKSMMQVDGASSRNNSATSFQEEKTMELTKPQYLLDAKMIYDSNNVFRLNEVKQEYVVQSSVEAGLIFQFSSNDCGGSLSRHHSDTEGMKNLMGQNLLQLASSQVARQTSRSHPIVPRTGTLYQQSQHSSVCIPRVRRGRPPKKSNLCPCPEAKENTNKFARICGPSGILGKLNPGIISRLRDRKQVHAVLEGVIRGAFMNGKKENLAIQNHVMSLARRREGTKEREMINKTSKQESILKLGYVNKDTDSSLAFRDDKEGQEHAINTAAVDLKSGQRAALGPYEVEKQEQSSREPNEQMGCPLSTSEQFSKEVTMECLAACAAQHNKQCSIEATEDQKSFESNVSFATGNVASCWLELLRLDIKGRLSALKRSKRRVRSVLVSGQLDDKLATQAAEMDKWRAFFLQMEHVLHLEGTRLESWLNQITQMQLSYCQGKGSHQSSMLPSLCGFFAQESGEGWATRLQACGSGASLVSNIGFGQ